MEAFTGDMQGFECNATLNRNPIAGYSCIEYHKFNDSNNDFF